MPDTFKWPCGKRTAHGPHGVEEDTKYEKPCPGVKAHPATQIGGDVKSERPELKEQP